MVNVVKMTRRFQLALLCFLLRIPSVIGAYITPVPQIPDLASWATVTVSQACGASCHGSFNETSCVQSGVCQNQQVCNGRTDLPPVERPLENWMLPSTSEGCIVSNQSLDNPPPALFQATGARTLIVNGSAPGLAPCFSQRASPVESIFTLVFWLKAACRNCSVLEMPQLESRAPIHLRVNGSSLCVGTDCETHQNIGQQQWLLVTVRVIESKMKIFMGSDQEISSSALDDVKIDNLYIGSQEIVSRTDIFHLYDVRYYADALTEREIATLKTGISDHGIDFPACQCPYNFIDLSSKDKNVCTNGGTTFPRFNDTVEFNDPNVMVDGDSSTKWASSDLGDVTLLLDFSMPFQIESIEITFELPLPKSVARIFISGNQEKEPKNFTCSASPCVMNMGTLDISSTVAELEAQTANKIKLVLSRDPAHTASYVISEIKVTGRCDCFGNAHSCTINSVGQPYTCDCDGNTNTQGPNCRFCSANFFRNPDQFDCPSSCHCNADGVIDPTKQCNETGGRCQCKVNVEGDMCDTCKPFTHSLNVSNPEGCSDCNCYQTGATSCRNTTGECVCKANTKPPSCNACDDYYFGLDSSEGCQPCNCDSAGTVSSSKQCHTTSGQCPCKDNVEGLTCDTCKAGFYLLETANLQGCKPCGCFEAGVEHGACNRTTGQCPCRGGVYTNRTCSPEVKSVDPVYGPKIGGTLVTISGQLLGNETHAPSVFLDDIQQELIKISDNAIVFKTQTSAAQNSAKLKLSWAASSSPLTTQTSFTYRPDPVLDTSRQVEITTFVSGGCRVTFYGSNFGSVKYPRLEVRNKANSNTRSVSDCQHAEDHILCPTPDVSNIYTSSSDQFEMTAILDGITSSNLGTIDVVPDPKIDSVDGIDFQYPFEHTITLHGKKLRSACQPNEYRVLLGVISCFITHVSDTEIECEPPGSPPGDNKDLAIKVYIGNIEKNVGTLHYLELYETTGFIIIISCIAGAILIVIGVIIICCCCRYRRKHASDDYSAYPKNDDSKDLVAAENRPMNTYSELTMTVDAPDVPLTANGHSGVVRMETVVREPKKGIVNSAAEDTTLSEEFLPKLEPGLREDVRQCFIGSGHFALGRHLYIKGQHTRLIDGSLQTGGSVQKLTIKSLINPITEHQLPPWANLAISECLRLRRHKHMHVLSIMGIGAGNDRFHILYPHMPQGILKTVVSDVDKDFSVRQLLSFGQQVAEGIDFLATKDITHKDVAARNCLIDEFSVVKLCDAAFSWDFYEDEYIYDEQRERYLPVRWMAPESLTDGYYDMRTDVWSFAVLVWELLTRGCLPFHEVTESEEVREYILHGYILGKPDTLTDDMYELLRSCWSSENEMRPTIASVSRSLSEILESDDDGTYANAGAVASYMSQHMSGKAATPRQNKGANDNIYSTTNLSRV